VRTQWETRRSPRSAISHLGLGLETPNAAESRADGTGTEFRPQVGIRFPTEARHSLKNAVFWDINTQFVPHRRHITSPLQCPVS
jgi:hypothetical protein